MSSGCFWCLWASFGCAGNQNSCLEGRPGDTYHDTCGLGCPVGALGLPFRGQRVPLFECFGSLLDPFGSLGTHPGSRRSPGSLQIDFCFNFWPIFEPGWVSMCVRIRLFSDVLCRTAAARAARVIRRARQARSEGNVEARSGFGVVSNGFNSMSSFLQENEHNAVCEHFPGPFLTRFRPVLTIRNHPKDLQFQGWY